MKRIVLTLICAAFMAACGGGPGSSVAIKFGTAGTTAGPSPANFSVAGGQATDGDIHLTGTNGDQLDISAIWVIVEEFELEAVETADCDDELGTDDCADFEREYFFIPVPLDGTTITVVSAEIPLGSYDELEIEVDDAEVDSSDSEEVGESDMIAALNAMIVSEGIASWPPKASMVVTGTWTPSDGSGAVTFETYFDADIEVELDIMNPVLVITDAGANRELIVLLNPASWFLNGGVVMNLKALEGQLVDFDLEIDDGFELKID